MSEAGEQAAASSDPAPAHSAATGHPAAVAAGSDAEGRAGAIALGAAMMVSGSLHGEDATIHEAEASGEASVGVGLSETIGAVSAAESRCVPLRYASANSQLSSRYGRGSGVYKRRVLEWTHSSQDGLIAEERSVDQATTDASTGEVWNRYGLTECISEICSERCESNRILERQGESAVGMALENSEGASAQDSRTPLEKHKMEREDSSTGAFFRTNFDEEALQSQEQTQSEGKVGKGIENYQNTSENGDSMWRDHSEGPFGRQKTEREVSSTGAFMSTGFEEEALQSEEPAHSNGHFGKEHHKLLSKNSQKQLLKLERYQLKKKERKAAEKERRHRETEWKRPEWETKLAALPAELQDRALHERKIAREARREQSSIKRERLRHGMQSAQNLVLDLDFCELMKPTELISLAQQVMYSYAANTRANQPMRLSLTGCRGDIRAQLEKVSGFSNWLLHKEERSYLDVFEERKADLVYLTADSEHLLDKLEESKIYIVGGLVDRNRWKGITYKKAQEQGISTARLPIAENLKIAASKVLTVNQVVEILLGFMESRDWAKVLVAAIPHRKLAADQEVNGMDAKGGASNDVYNHK
ncbi:hypothetical protein O6H91_23G039700 [Diphasiastrum complanatum]|uniref:Uncharacterized protein n=1 Tax=Diphasiastrum complanatum TaxID=34168 RepID=A0ACC2A9V4_DIPCM|nr:hypothetical protein O6H91_23G039700 [Diphasiastrum complanatum]